MCCNFKYLSKTANGFLVYCSHSKLYQFSYKNLNFNFTEKEREGLLDYLTKINCDYWEKEYKNSIYNKKIPIPTLQSNFMILVNREEIYEIVSLIDIKNKNTFIDLKKLCYVEFLN